MLKKHGVGNTKKKIIYSNDLLPPSRHQEELQKVPPTDLWAEAVTVDGRQSRPKVSSTVQVVMGRV